MVGRPGQQPRRVGGDRDDWTEPSNRSAYGSSAAGRGGPVEDRPPVPQAGNIPRPSQQPARVGGDRDVLGPPAIERELRGGDRPPAVSLEGCPPVPQADLAAPRLPGQQPGRVGGDRDADRSGAEQLRGRGRGGSRGRPPRGLPAGPTGGRQHSTRSAARPRRPRLRRSGPNRRTVRGPGTRGIARRSHRRTLRLLDDPVSSQVAPESARKRRS
jgi:hypothetical protein